MYIWCLQKQDLTDTQERGCRDSSYASERGNGWDYPLHLTLDDAGSDKNQWYEALEKEFDADFVRDCRAPTDWMERLLKERRKYYLDSKGLLQLAEPVVTMALNRKPLHSSANRPSSTADTTASLAQGVNAAHDFDLDITVKEMQYEFAMEAQLALWLKKKAVCDNEEEPSSAQGANDFNLSHILKKTELKAIVDAKLAIWSEEKQSWINKKARMATEARGDNKFGDYGGNGKPIFGKHRGDAVAGSTSGRAWMETGAAGTCTKIKGLGLERPSTRGNHHKTTTHPLSRAKKSGALAKRGGRR
jgi:hypothetical protein